jgi:hypothetical protein
MGIKRITTVLSAVVLTAAGPGSALAASSTSAPASSTAAPALNVRSAHASLRLDVGRPKAWVGQALPVTLRAYFRGAEGVTIEGVPQIESNGIFTSQLAREPRQSTEMVGGEPVLVATWTGTVTPSSPGTLPLTAELPVRVRYREAAPQAAMPDLRQDDPFAAFGGNPFDTPFFRRFTEQSAGRVREESVSLRATVRPIDALALPVAGQPSTFTGAVGRFDLKASLSSASGHVSEPLTLTIVVSGDGDLDRVDLTGVPTSGVWKTYPPSVRVNAGAASKPVRKKVFEQVLVPLRGGELTLPAVSLVSFDTASGQYVTGATSPLAVPVEGAATIAEVPTPTVIAPSSPAPDTIEPAPHVGPLVRAEVVRPSEVIVRLVPALLLVLAAGVFALLRRRRTERALRRTMRRAASRSSVAPFYRAAHALIETRLSRRWGIRPDDVSVNVIRERIGEDGDPLAEVLAADEALRFGRAQVATTDLLRLCSSIERSLGGVS